MQERLAVLTRGQCEPTVALFSRNPRWELPVANVILVEPLWLSDSALYRDFGKRGDGILTVLQAEPPCEK